MKDQRSHSPHERAKCTLKLSPLGKIIRGTSIFVGLSSLSLFAQEPTEYDQYSVELINFARMNPQAEVDRHPQNAWGNPAGTGIPDLNEGIAAGTISSNAKQPLAYDLNLGQAASLYTTTLLDNDAFTHNYAGTSPTSRSLAAGTDVSGGAYGFSENIAVTLSSFPVSISGNRIDDQHEQLFVDGTINNRGHRVTMMNDAYSRIGVSAQSSTDYNILNGYSNGLLQTQKYGWVEDDYFITGVAYNDLNFNNFYTPGIGEALGGVTIEAYLAGTFQRVATTTSYASGGYSLQVDPGVYDVYLFGLGVDAKASAVEISDQNVKVDFIDPGNSPVPEPSALIYGVIAAWCLGMRRRRRK